MTRGFMFLAAATLATTLAVPASAGGADAAAALYPPDAEPFGMTYAEWQGAYQVWLGEIPAPENPLHDPASPRNCAEQPGGDIVFIGPGGDIVFIGPVGGECSVSDDVALALSPGLGFCGMLHGRGARGHVRRVARLRPR